MERSSCLRFWPATDENVFKIDFEGFETDDGVDGRCVTETILSSYSLESVCSLARRVEELKSRQTLQTKGRDSATYHPEEEPNSSQGATEALE